MAAKPLERGVTIALPQAPELALEGVYSSGADGAGAIIAPPHPLYGGSMDHPVVSEIAYAFAKRGTASLRFNWRGVGASAGVPSGDLEDGEADYAAALEQLAETVPGELAACGYSYGAVVAAHVARRNPRVARLLLVAPPPSLLDREALAAFPGAVRLVAGENDEFAPAAAVGELSDACSHATLTVVSGADHFFGAGLAELGRSVSEWLD